MDQFGLRNRKCNHTPLPVVIGISYRIRVSARGKAVIVPWTLVGSGQGLLLARNGQLTASGDSAEPQTRPSSLLALYRTRGEQPIIVCNPLQHVLLPTSAELLRSSSWRISP